MDNESLMYTLSFAEDKEWESAMELAWRTFLRFEADEYGREGTDNFLNFISGELLHRMFLDGDYILAVARDGDRLVGIASIRNRNHISLLFVDEDYQRKGIGKALLSFLQQKLIKEGSCVMTVNAAPSAVPFYEKAGFSTTDDMQTADGITYVPMICFGEIIP